MYSAESMTPRIAYASLSFQNRHIASNRLNPVLWRIHANSKIFGNVLFCRCVCCWFYWYVCFVYFYRRLRWCVFISAKFRAKCTHVICMWVLYTIPKPVASTHCAIIGIIILDKILLHKCWFGFVFVAFFVFVGQCFRKSKVYWLWQSIHTSTQIIAHIAAALTIHEIVCEYFWNFCWSFTWCSCRGGCVLNV